MCFFFFQAEDGIRDLVRSRGLGDVYKRQVKMIVNTHGHFDHIMANKALVEATGAPLAVHPDDCLLYTSDAADDLLCVDLGGRRIIKKKTNQQMPAS